MPQSLLECDMILAEVNKFVLSPNRGWFNGFQWWFSD